MAKGEIGGHHSVQGAGYIGLECERVCWMYDTEGVTVDGLNAGVDRGQ